MTRFRAENAFVKQKINETKIKGTSRIFHPIPIGRFQKLGVLCADIIKSPTLIVRGANRSYEKYGDIT